MASDSFFAGGHTHPFQQCVAGQMNASCWPYGALISCASVGGGNYSCSHSSTLQPSPGEEAALMEGLALVESQLSGAIASLGAASIEDTELAATRQFWIHLHDGEPCAAGQGGNCKEPGGHCSCSRRSIDGQELCLCVHVAEGINGQMSQSQRDGVEKMLTAFREPQSVEWQEHNHEAHHHH